MRYVDIGSSKLAVTVIAAALLALGMVACGADPTATPTVTPAVEAPAAWEVEWEETLAAAQQEGELTMILGAAASRLMAPVYEEFTRQFGIKVIASTGSGSSNTTRILAERSRGRFTVDFNFGGTTSTKRLIDGQVTFTSSRLKTACGCGCALMVECWKPAPIRLTPPLR